MFKAAREDDSLVPLGNWIAVNAVQQSSLNKKRNMTTLHLKTSIAQSPLRLAFLLIPLVFACFALAPTTRAVSPPPDGGCSCSAGADMPLAATRGVGVFFPANGKFYFMGGHDADNVELTNPFEYDPVANTWTTKSATYPDPKTNDMACAVLKDLSGRDLIYCVGGSNIATNGTTGRVFSYDPVADVFTWVHRAVPGRRVYQETAVGCPVASVCFTTF